MAVIREADYLWDWRGFVNLYLSEWVHNCVVLLYRQEDGCGDVIALARGVGPDSCEMRVFAEALVGDDEIEASGSRRNLYLDILDQLVRRYVGEADNQG